MASVVFAAASYMDHHHMAFVVVVVVHRPWVFLHSIHVLHSDVVVGTSIVEIVVEDETSSLDILPLPGYLSHRCSRQGVVQKVVEKAYLFA